MADVTLADELTAHAYGTADPPPEAALPVTVPATSAPEKGAEAGGATPPAPDAKTATPLDPAPGTAPAATPGDDVGDKEKVTVPLGILRAERGKRQERDQELAALRAENERLKQQPQRKESEQPGPDDTELADLEQLIQDDEPLTARQANRLTELRMGQAQRTAEQAHLEQVRTVVLDSHNLALATFTADKLGEGLDYKTVWQAGYENLSPRDKQRIEQAGEDASAMMYDLCIARTPELRQRQQDHQSKQADAGKIATGPGGQPPGKTQPNPPAAPDPSKAPGLDAILDTEGLSVADQLSRQAYPPPPPQK